MKQGTLNPSAPTKARLTAKLEMAIHQYQFMPVSSAQIKELTSRMERKGRDAGYTATVCGATPALLDQVCGTRLQHEGARLIAQHCKQARLTLEATQAVNRHDSGTPQHDSKVAGSWSSEQQPTQNIAQDTPEFGGIGPTIRSTRPCTKPAAAVAIDTAADQKGAEPPA